jgi:hypothetical protein
MAPRGTKASPTSLKLRRALSAAAAGASRAARRMAARDRARPSSIGPTLTCTHTRTQTIKRGGLLHGRRARYVRTFSAAGGVLAGTAAAFWGSCGTCRRKCSRRRSRLAADSPPRKAGGGSTKAAARSAKARSGTAVAATRPPPFSMA